MILITDPLWHWPFVVVDHDEEGYIDLEDSGYTDASEPSHGAQKEEDWEPNIWSGERVFVGQVGSTPMWDIKGFGYEGCILFVPQVLCLEYKTSDLYSGQ